MRPSPICLLAAILAGGCGVPQPPQAVNAQTENHTPYVLPKSEIVNASPTPAANLVELQTGKPTIEQYAKQDEGDWDKLWFVVALPVERVTQGDWPEKHVRFVVTESWPKPETGLMVNRQPWPWKMGQMFHIVLDTGTTPPTIISADPQRRPGTAWRHGVTEPPLATEP